MSHALIQFPRRTRNFTSWVLILGFLCQPFLAYLATPMSVQDSHGIHAVICTLKGMQREVIVDLPAFAEEEAGDECPAVKLIQLAGSAQISLPKEAPSTMLYVVGYLEPAAVQHHYSPQPTVYSSRAPPLV